MQKLIQITLSAAVLLVGGSSASADPKQQFLGVWGTEAQCNREPIKDGGTVLAEPYEIGAQWLKHGDLWCSLSWGPVEDREGEYFTLATAKCGEDSVLDYLLGMTLADEMLTLRWDITLRNGPLQRCAPNK